MAEMVDSWLCFVTHRKIFGINLRNLIKSPDSWSCLPTLNFDFCSDLPSPSMCPFVFDSNIVDPYFYPLGFPPNPIYKFRLHMDKKGKQLQPGGRHTSHCSPFWIHCLLHPYPFWIHTSQTSQAMFTFMWIRIDNLLKLLD